MFHLTEISITGTYEVREIVLLSFNPSTLYPKPRLMQLVPGLSVFAKRPKSPAFPKFRMKPLTNVRAAIQLDPEAP